MPTIVRILFIDGVKSIKLVVAVTLVSLLLSGCSFGSKSKNSTNTQGGLQNIEAVNNPIPAISVPGSTGSVAQRSAGQITGANYRSPSNGAKGQVINASGASNQIIVQPGQTIYSISRQYGVSVSTLMAVNGLKEPQELRAGFTLVIPSTAPQKIAQTAANIQPPVLKNAPVSKNAPMPVKKAASDKRRANAVHVVEPGETLFSIARKYGVSVESLAAANRLSKTVKLHSNQRIGIPGATQIVRKSRNPGAVALSPARPAGTVNAPQPKVLPLPKQATKKPARPRRSGRVVPLSPQGRTTGAKKSSSTGVAFRAPVNGRIISGFGGMNNGQRNEGVNFALPQGTDIRAAEDGRVIYAGNELKGYGNLVLVRHADNWVTAYAHNSKMLVKKGDSVRRGQIIAKAGQTGSVTSPQLHFELRKNAKPVDPANYIKDL